jgi:ABC-type uncharacterized transport system permease subunit
VITIAGCYALGAFTIAILSGLWAGRAASEILTTALISLICCYMVGLLVGKTAEVAVHDHVERYESENVAPDSSKAEAALHHAAPAHEPA